MSTPNWQRLAKEVLARRLGLGLKQTDLADLGGPSYLSVSLIERAAQGRYRGLTLSKLEAALGWKPGTVAAILDGSAGEDPGVWLRAASSGAVTNCAAGDALEQQLAELLRARGWHVCQYGECAK